MSIWLDSLNPEQIEAVKHNQGPMLILAGAGSGKTTVLISRAGRLIEEGICKPENLLVLTFTNKAAKELKQRVCEKLGKKGAKIWAGTFHSFGLNLIKQYHKKLDLPKRFAILSQNDAQGIIKDIIRSLHIYNKEDFDLAKVQSYLSTWCEKGIRKATNDDPYEDLVEMLYPKYEERLKEIGAVDFDRLIYYPKVLINQYPKIKEAVLKQFPYIMIDEFQDTNSAQMSLVKAIVKKENPNLTVVGDDDQSIYAWRGADIQNILKFPTRFKNCKVVKLVRNYRCNPAVLDVANHIIKKNDDRHHKDLLAEKKDFPNIPEIFVYQNEGQEAEKTMNEIHRLLKKGVKASDIAVLYRSNSQGGFLEGFLRKERIPYKISGNTAFFDRKEIKDILAFLHAALNHNEVYFRRILNTPHRGIGLQSVEKIQQGNKPSFYQNTKNWQALGISESVGKNIDQFLQNLDAFKKDLLTKSSARDTVFQFLEHIGYKDYLRKMAKKAEFFQKQWMLIDTFVNILDSFQEQKAGKDGLYDFLDSMSLRDHAEDKTEDKIQLLTFHACKGLEFPHVFILGIEEELLPHARLGTNVNEERRLFYVAITRAKDALYMSRNLFRKRNGRLKKMAASRFLLEIPREKVKIYEDGNRPLNKKERKDLVADFLSGLKC